MKRQTFIALGLAQSAWFALGGARAAQTGVARRLTATAKGFVLDGGPLQIISGEMHYARVPHQYWRERLRMARAMGLNTISTYVFWNVHEPRPGEYTFADGANVGGFVRAAQEEGLHVILRPGPYSCAEWDFGGYPAWLLADNETTVRSRDPRFMKPARAWLARLGEELAPLQYGNGGPIVAVQVENEYGSYGHDRAYMAEVRDAITAAGFNAVYKYTADGADELAAGTLPDLPCVGNFGPGGARDELAKLQRFRPNQPTMCGEYWCGWFDHWGEAHQQTDAAQQAADLAWMLSRGYSLNLYMFHGGTNFGFMNGANYSKESPYQPTTTSYDYDAPLDEGGHPTDKFRLFQTVIARHRGLGVAAVPRLTERIPIARFALDEVASFRPLLGSAVHRESPLSMEALGQDYGYVLYRANLSATGTRQLAFADVRDYGIVFVNGRRIADLDRRRAERAVTLRDLQGETTLEVLVENTGRINFGHELANDRKGLFGPVMLGESFVTGWSMYALPMQSFDGLRFGREAIDGPAFYRGSFTIEKPGDTFVDVRMLGKGALWVNGHAAGRFWSIGPQYALYVPAPWLKTGRNTIVAFDLLSDRSARELEGRTQPLYAPIEQ